VEPKEVYREAYLEWALAMDRLALYEQEGGPGRVDQANQSLERAVFLFVAAEDRLVATLLANYIAPKEVVPATPEPGR
jgi:hypothetical protein